MTFRATYQQYFVVVLSLFSLLFLWSAKRTHILPSQKTTAKNNAPSSINTMLSPLQGNLQSEFSELEKKLATSQTPNDSLQIINNLLILAENNRLYDYAAYYQEKRLNIDSSVVALKSLVRNAQQACELHQQDSSKYTYWNTKVLEYLSKLQNKEPTNPEWVLQEGVYQVRSRNSALFMQGIQKIIQLTRQYPDYFDAFYYLGVFSLESNQPEKAIQRFEKCLSLQPNHALSHFGMASAYESLGQISQARTHYQKALKATSDNQLKSSIQQKLNQLNHQH